MTAKFPSWGGPGRGGQGLVTPVSDLDSTGGGRGLLGKMMSPFGDIVSLRCLGEPEEVSSGQLEKSIWVGLRDFGIHSTEYGGGLGVWGHE